MWSLVSYNLYLGVQYKIITMIVNLAIKTKCYHGTNIIWYYAYLDLILIKLCTYIVHKYIPIPILYLYIPTCFF